MILTSSEANKLLRKLSEEWNILYSKESDTREFMAATIEKLEDARPDYDFSSTQEKFEQIEAAVRKVKHAINVFNVTTTVPGFDMTIDELLTFLPQLTSKISKLKAMAEHSQKTRVGTSGTNIIEYEYANYDVNEAHEYYKTAVELKAKAQTALDLINNTVQFEIDLDDSIL